MPHVSRQSAIVLALTLLLPPAGYGDEDIETTYVCPPCTAHDTLAFKHDGECPVCGMKLIEKPDSSRVGDVHIHEGSGAFLVEGGPGHQEKLVTVYYHRPESFSPKSPILLVVPGAGRDAWEYRDAWVEASEEHGVLVLSPSYPESTYDFEDYHMGGVVEESNALEIIEFVEHSSQAKLDEERLVYEVNEAQREWIFHDFDRIFEMASAAVGSERTAYDAFGHSAGGQILHRLVLFHPNAKVDRIVAANSGFYTLPDLESRLPFGLKNTPVDEEDLRASFRRDLVLLLGGEDDHPEAGGTFLRSPSADEQGEGRLQRGRHFHETGKAKASELGVGFNWKVETVPGIGHEFRPMSEAAGKYLYGEGSG